VAIDRGSRIWNRRFYHGTLETDAQSAVSNITAHLENVRIIQEYGVTTKHLGKGLYFGESPGSPSIPGSPAWWAQRGGSLGRPGSGAILEVRIPRWRIPSIRRIPGVKINVVQEGPSFVPQSFFPFEGGSATTLGNIGTWGIYNPNTGALSSLIPTIFSGQLNSLFNERQPNEKPISSK